MTTLVVLHPARPACADAPLEAWIEGLDPLPVATVADLNARIRDLDLHDTMLVGVHPCDDYGPCPYAATVAVLTATPDRYQVRQCCGTHAPAEAPADGCLIDGIVNAAAYTRRREGAEVADLTRALILHDADPAVFTQPACRNCRRHVMPGLFPQLSWLDADGNPRCGKRAGHIVAEGEPAAVITAWALGLRSLMPDDDEEGPGAEVVSITGGVPLAS
jgi:hypothetical protein